MIAIVDRAYSTCIAKRGDSCEGDSIEGDLFDRNMKYKCHALVPHATRPILVHLLTRHVQYWFIYSRDTSNIGSITHATRPILVQLHHAT